MDKYNIITSNNLGIELREHKTDRIIITVDDFELMQNYGSIMDKIEEFTKETTKQGYRAMRWYDHCYHREVFEFELKEGLCQD